MIKNGVNSDFILKKLAVMKNERAPWEPMWHKTAEMCAVDAKLFQTDQRGKIRQAVFDSTGRNALACFAASLKSVIVPTTSRWHRLKPSDPKLDEDYDVKKYLEYATDLLFRVRYGAQANFAEESDLLFNQLGLYGHAVWMVEDVIGQGIAYRSIPIDEVYVKRDEFGKLKEVFRVYKLSAEEALEKFGRENCSTALKEAGQNRPSQLFEFVHAVYKQENTLARKKDFRGMKFASVHLEIAEKHIVRVGGYRTCPYMVPRFLGVSGSDYGDSPALQAFYDMLTANEMAKTILRTGQLQANPPILTATGLMDTAKLGAAGAVIRGGLDTQGKPMAMSMQYGNNLAVSVEMQREVRASIERAFLVPLFQSLTQTKTMTATEVEKREIEKSMLLAPMCERIASEWLCGNIERELDILTQSGKLDGVPDALLYDGAIAIEFESPAVHMQESSKIMGLYKTMEAAVSMAQTNPEILDVFDMETALRKIADYNGVNSDIVRTKEDLMMMKQRATMENALALLNVADHPLNSALNRG